MSEHDEAPRLYNLLKRLRGYNPPDRTVDAQRRIAEDIEEAADRIEALLTELAAERRAREELREAALYVVDRLRAKEPHELDYSHLLSVLEQSRVAEGEAMLVAESAEFKLAEMTRERNQDLRNHLENTERMQEKLEDVRARLRLATGALDEIESLGTIETVEETRIAREALAKIRVGEAGEAKLHRAMEALREATTALQLAAYTGVPMCAVCGRSSTQHSNVVAALANARAVLAEAGDTETSPAQEGSAVIEAPKAELEARHARVVELAQKVVAGIDQWNEATQVIVGRAPNYSWGDLEALRAALRAEVGDTENSETEGARAGARPLTGEAAARRSVVNPVEKAKVEAVLRAAKEWCESTDWKPGRAARSPQEWQRITGSMDILRAAVRSLDETEP